MNVFVEMFRCSLKKRSNTVFKIFFLVFIVKIAESEKSAKKVKKLFLFFYKFALVRVSFER